MVCGLCRSVLSKSGVQCCLQVVSDEGVISPHSNRGSTLRNVRPLSRGLRSRAKSDEGVAE
jgi:hypothetical protein